MSKIRKVKKYGHYYLDEENLTQGPDLFIKNKKREICRYKNNRLIGFKISIENNN